MFLSLYGCDLQVVITSSTLMNTNSYMLYWQIVKVTNILLDLYAIWPSIDSAEIQTLLTKLTKARTGDSK